ncbi:hypothetical protein EG19_08780 [Thermoanaerobaculum aquaticum]|uniref:Uncharacterized protein n=1 Tax=Thermoanaerobaculum aquaticum TaxID=1312852 RepID=A0A062XK85_9BACT|nr:hypothetical protein EG19_08780 [Thermoanaerobaculum aquaticum]
MPTAEQVFFFFLPKLVIFSRPNQRSFPTLKLGYRPEFTVRLHAIPSGSFLHRFLHGKPKLRGDGSCATEMLDAFSPNYAQVFGFQTRNDPGKTVDHENIPVKREHFIL